MTSEFDEGYAAYVYARPSLPVPVAKRAPPTAPAADGEELVGEIQMMPIVSIPLALLLDLVNLGRCHRDCVALITGKTPGTIQAWADRRAPLCQ